MQTIALMSSDGQYFNLKEAEAAEMQTIKHMIEDGCAGSAIPVPNVTGVVLAKVIDYCKKHVEDAKADVLRAWDTDFINVDQADLYDLMMAANYLDIKGLLNLTCQKVADMIKGKSPEQIREIFHIENDFTPEEEVEIRGKNRWAFE